MIGLFNSSSSFSLPALNVLKQLADSIYISFGDNPYLEPVNIPDYVDTGDSTDGLITVANGRFNSTYLNRADINNFYIEPGDYSSQGRVTLTESGTEAIPRTLSLHDGANTHPASLSEAENANIALEFIGSYWTVTRVSAYRRMYTDTYDGGIFLFQRFCSNNILDRVYTVDGGYMTRFKHQANYNTVQRCYTDTPSDNLFPLDVSQHMLVDWYSGMMIEGTKFILNESRNFKFFKLHDSEGTPGEDEPAYNGTIIDSNITWFDSDTYADKDGTPNPNGKYSMSEQGFGGFKKGSIDINNPVIFSNNIGWGGQPTHDDPSGVLSSGAPGMLVCYLGTKYVNLYGNMQIGTSNGINVADRYDEEYGNTGITITENILYQLGKTDETSETHTGSARLSQAYQLNYHDNLIKEPRGAYARVEWNFAGCKFENNTIVDMDLPIYYANNNYPVYGLDPDDLNTYLTGAQADAIYTEDYTFTYLKYTTSPQQTTIPKVLRPDQTRTLNEA